MARSPSRPRASVIGFDAGQTISTVGRDLHPSASAALEELAPAVARAPAPQLGSALDSWEFVKGSGAGELSVANSVASLMTVSSVAPKTAASALHVPMLPLRRQSVMPVQGSSRDDWNFVLGSQTASRSSAPTQQQQQQQQQQQHGVARTSVDADSVSLMSLGDSDVRSLASNALPVVASKLDLPPAPGKRRSVFQSSQI
jgi:hypothetical protein